jgi:hypothetical protein
MHKKNKIASNMVSVALIVAISLLTACATITYPTTVCHASGDTVTPYTAITVNNAEELLAHRTHANDLYPMPVGGCPATLVEVNNSKITICHATGSEKNPYTEITVSVQGLNGHALHEGDIIPMPVGGCPLTNPNPSKQK